MFYSTHKDGMDGMIREAWKLLDEADAVVHYNGEKFDMPTLSKEFVLQGIPPPAPYHHIDLLKTARQRFNFVSNKLDYVAQALGIGAKVPHKGMDLWRECMDGDEKAWKVMERYNKQDVKLLPLLYKRLLPWIKNHPNHALYSDSDRPTCPNCGAVTVVKCGTETTMTGLYQRYRCKKCYTPLRGRTTLLTKERRGAVLTQSKL